MTLTAKQEAFAQAVANGLNHSDAYRTAYKPKPMSNLALHVRAYEVATNSKVIVRVAMLKGKLEQKALWTREMSVSALSGIAQGSDKGTEIVAAVKELNLMHGFNAPTKIEHSGGFELIERRIIKAK